jgi:hypothetical protein
MVIGARVTVHVGPAAHTLGAKGKGTEGILERGLAHRDRMGTHVPAQHMCVIHCNVCGGSSVEHR